MVFPYCSSCKARKNLCGLGYCPILKSVKQAVPMMRKIEGNVETDTPPGIFVGSYGYPGVLAGPTALFQREIFDYSTERKTLNMEQNISFNSNIYRTASLINVKNPEPKISEYILESASSIKSFEIEFNSNHFSMRGADGADFFDTPVGSTAMISSLRVTGNPKVPRLVDYVHEDYDLKATEAVMNLYKGGFRTEYIQNIVAGGVVGLKNNRKMVPTRWSITATDDMIFKNLKREITKFQWIDDIRVFHGSLLGNRFQIVLIPGPFTFEMLEQWNRGSLWGAGSVAVDYEDTGGRTKYASEITGAYYAARLSVSEYLISIKRQASVLVIRNIGSEYYSPLGVWVIRSGVKDSLNTNFERFDSILNLKKDTNFIISETAKRSKTLNDSEKQRRLIDYQ